LEEIVGEIIDETDKVEPHIVKLNRNEWRVLGKSEIDDVNEKLDMAIPDTKEYDTFSGYVLDQIGRIPEEKEDILLGNFVVTVNEMDGTRIKEYIVRKEEDISQEAEQAS
jgi:CBS domain containing-hemolysin-like protein